MKKTLLSISLALLLSTAPKAQINSEIFADLIGVQPTVEINLGPTMLSLLSSASKNDEGISKILSSLSAINVIVFELENSNGNKISSIKSEINKLAEGKVSSGYEKIATIKEDDSLVYIFAKSDQNKFNNLSIYALDDEDELVLININGEILMSEIGDLMDHFDVDLGLNDL